MLFYRSYAQNNLFQIALQPLTISGLSGIQSYAAGQHNGKWLIVGGRLDGLHKAMGMGMMGTPFPTSSNNNEIIVIDPVVAQKWTASLSSLPVDIQEQLSATNPQYYQTGNYLYVLGGYGYKNAVSKHQTFDKLTAIDVPNVINAVINGTSFTSFIRQITDTQFQVTGGELAKIYDTYYLVGGHNFDGTYHHMGGMGMFTQTYSNQIRKFILNDDGANINITHLPAITDSVNLHRRDYNMVAQIMPNGKEGLTAFSGVFQQTVDLPFLNCVNIDSSGYVVNNTFSQYYNHYQCANLPLYNASTNEMHTIFFGGIAQYYDNAGVLVQDNNVPFVKTIAMVSRTANGVMSEYKLPVEMPALLGAGSEFIMEKSLAHYENEILKLDSLNNDTTLVGYVFGGINSPNPNVFNTMMGGNNGTTASSQLFKVFLIKNATTGLPQLNPQSQNSLQFQVYPNPNEGDIHIYYNLTKKMPVKIQITDVLGNVLMQESITNTVLGQNSFEYESQKLTSEGIYFISIETKEAKAFQKVVIKK